MPTLADLRLAVTAAEAAHTNITTTAKDAADAWQVKVNALGAQPPAGTEPTPPTKPATDRPADIDAARALVAAAPLIRDRHTRYAAKLAADQRAADQAAETLTTATARAVLVTATLAATRQAPSDIAREQADLLETPRVRFVFPTERTKQTPHVVAEFNHPKSGWIPFAAASSGEKVEASVHVQARIRELATTKAPAFGYVPIVADLGDYNGGAGPYPDVPGFVLWHVSSEAGSPLTVSPGRPA